MSQGPAGAEQLLFGMLALHFRGRAFGHHRILPTRCKNKAKDGKVVEKVRIEWARARLGGARNTKRRVNADSTGVATAAKPPWNLELETAYPMGWEAI
jgi:hypothetical protein